MKKIVVFLLITTILFFGDSVASAEEYSSEQDYYNQIEAGKQIYDFSQILDDNKQAELEKTLDKAIQASKLDIVLVTTNQKFGNKAVSLCDSIYEKGGFGYEDNIENASGVVFLIDMEERHMEIATYGIAILYLNDEVIDLLLDDVEEEVSEGNYEQAYKEFIEDVVYFSNMAQSTKEYKEVIKKWYEGKYVDYWQLEQQNKKEFDSFEELFFDFDKDGLVYLDEEIDVYNYDYQGYEEITIFSIFANPFINFVIGAIIAGITVLIMANHGKTKMTVNGNTYKTKEGFHINIKTDTFLRRTTVKRKIETNSGGGKGNGGGGSHTKTSSGRSRGGGGRSF